MIECKLLPYDAKNRLSYQFKDKPTISGLINAFIDGDLEQSSCDLLTKRGLNSSSGKQLDGIGEIVGVKRPRLFETDDGNFGFDGDDSSRGFTDALNILNGGFLGSVTPAAAGLADDDKYRLIIKAKIFQNSTNMTVDETLNILSILFQAKISYFLPVNLYPVYQIGKEFFEFERELIKNFPELIGIGKVQYVSYPENEGFGFDGDSDALGFGDSVTSSNGGYLASII